MTQQHLVSIVITDEDEQEVMQSIARIETRLKGLISLAPHKRRFRRMGQTQEARARGIIRALQQNPQMVPPGLDVAGAVADLAAFERIARIDDAMQRVSSLVNDTRAGLGIDIMSVAKVGYTLSKTFGGALGLGDLVKEFGSRFAGGRKKKEAEPEEDEPKS